MYVKYYAVHVGIKMLYHVILTDCFQGKVLPHF